MICPAIQRIDTRAFAAAETTAATAETIAAAITAAPHLYLPDPDGAAVNLIIGSPRQPPRAIQLIPHHADLLLIAAAGITGDDEHPHISPADPGEHSAALARAHITPAHQPAIAAALTAALTTT